MNTRETQAKVCKAAELEVVTVANSAVKNTMGGSGPYPEIEGTGGTKFG
jgi:hypothetical protein